MSRDQDGRPTERAKLWRDDEHYPEVCKSILAEIYPSELMHAVPDPNAEKAKAKSWFGQQTGVGEDAANRMVALYSVLVEADPSKQINSEKRSTGKKVPDKSASATPRVDGHRDHSETGTAGLPSSSHGPEVHINLQIHISADASPDQIEQIFASMSKHLYKCG